MMNDIAVMLARKREIESADIHGYSELPHVQLNDWLIDAIELLLRIELERQRENGATNERER
jgi:hypothetical protein